ncbi:hypothetical protein DW846_02420 [Ruminococcus sp. AM36-2AA]|nr:hypothetical protein DW851_02415 [Ruminococcus sp. AM36-5]RGH62471.1 hypothetical protein DW846_02420 [Ruminococcus sp. AM36-2AA]
MQTNHKVLSTVIDITQLLCKNSCTYDEAYKILNMVTAEFKQQQENLEYATYDDYFAGTKTDDVSNKVIAPLNHAGGY